LSICRLPLALSVLLTATSCVVSVPVSTSQDPTYEARPVFTQGKGTRNPIIQSFTATPTNVTQGQAITFQALAHDPDGQPLQFNWSTTDGTLSTNTGQVVSWIPPAKPGTYTVMVTVSNGRGGFATGAHNLIVQPDGSAKIGVTPMASAAPTVPIAPSSTPSAPDSVVPSPTTSPMDSPSPVASPTASPTPTPTPVASTERVGLRLDAYSSLEAPNDRPTPAFAGPGYPINYRVVSASNTRYEGRFTQVGASGTVTRYGEFTSVDGTKSLSYGNPNRGVYVLQFKRVYPEPETSELESIQMNDGALYAARLTTNAVKMAESNWPVPANAYERLQVLDGTMFVFRYEGPKLDLGTFHLP
jgi:hypothetical protein